MKKKIKIALIGCGRVADHYAKIFQKKIDKKLFNIIAVCDSNKKNLVKFSNTFKCKGYLNYNDLLNNDLIDLAIVLTPSGTHYKIVKKFLKAKINVLCEKPLTLLPKENINLSKLANKNKVILSVAFQNRLNPAVVFLKNYIDKKNLAKW